MSIFAEKIEPGFEVRWLKNSLLFIYNNPFTLMLYILTVVLVGCIILYTPLKHVIYSLSLICSTYFIFLMYNIQYEISYKKINLTRYLSLLKESLEDIFKYIRVSQKAQILKLVAMIALMLFFDMSRERLEFPLKREHGLIYYDDLIIFLLLSSSWSLIIIENTLMRNYSEGIFNKTAFSCEFILNKFSNFSQESSIQEATDKLIVEAGNINQDINYKLCAMSNIFSLLFFIASTLHPIINLFFYLIIPIFFFQAGKETFLDQGNKKNQKQEQEEKSTTEVPDASGA